MGIILDLIVIAIVALFAFLSAKRGFVRTLIEIVGFVIVVLLANAVSGPLADYTYDKTVEPTLVKSVSGVVSESTSSISINMDSLPGIVKNTIGTDVLTNFENSISDNLSSGAESAVASASQTIIKPVVSGILSMIYILIISIVLLFVVKILARIINKMFSFSIIGKANSILGGVLGIAKGLVIAFIFCTLVALIVSFTENGFAIFTDTAINESHIFKLLCFNY